MAGHLDDARVREDRREEFDALLVLIVGPEERADLRHRASSRVRCVNEAPPSVAADSSRAASAVGEAYAWFRPMPYVA